MRGYHYHPSSLPNQIVDYTRKKNDKLAKETTDVLERIARVQLRENKSLNDYYKMFEGRLVWADYSNEDLSLLDDINNLLVDTSIKVPSFVKHYDILGIISNQVVGEWLSSRDDYYLDWVNDGISDNEYLRERSRRLEETVMQSFELEFKLLMAERGFAEQTEFESQEEQQAYIQQLEQLRDEIKTPEQIEKEMRGWRTQAVNWGNAVLQQDNFRFRMEELDREETTDYVLTGRYFRNYYIGYDYYKPERWDPRLVFFSRDQDAAHPQDLEYCGIQYRMPIYKVKERFGHIISGKELQKLEERYSWAQNQNYDINSKRGLYDSLFGNTEQHPFYNYKEHEDAIEMQDLFDIPMGENIVQTDEGEVRIPYYLDNNESGLRFGDPIIERGDYQIRRDTILVTEAYYKSTKKMWVAKYTDQDGIFRTDIFSSELLPEFIKDNGLKVDRTKSLEEIEESLKENTIYPIYVPEVRKSLKINAGIDKDTEFYYDDALPFQIKGDSNVFDVKLPVGGVINSNFIANKIRPYQIAYNICLNQIMNMMEKELGMFFLFDINLLPAEYKVYGDTGETLLKLQEFIKDTGLAPIDTSKQNTQQNMSQANTFMYQDLSYTNHISARMQWAENYKRLAIEQIGMNQQRLGNPSQYETATGIQQGVQASYAQTEGLFSKLSNARLRTMELHLAVAQYCQKEYLDVDFVYSTDEKTKSFIHLSDPDFPLRRIGVVPMNDSKKRAQREMLVQTLMNLNTLGGDILDYAGLFTAKSTQEILAIGKKARQERLAEEQQSRTHQQEMLDKQLESQRMEKEAELAFKAEESRLEREKDVKVAQITALGRAADKESDVTGIAEINRQAENSLRSDSLNHQIDKDNRTLSLKEESERRNAEIKQKELELKERDIAQKERRAQTDMSIATINKN